VRIYWFLIENDGAFLLVQRKEDAPPFAGRWVLPGGEAPQSEWPDQMARRIGRDEFGVDVMGTEGFKTIGVKDGQLERSIDVYRLGFEGMPHFRESGPYAEVGWAEPGDLEDLDFELPAELKALLEGLAGGD
jgi:ADP-ribose pyrophosphatase YjhB (NUDIX family)